MVEVFTKSFRKAQQCSIPAQGRQEGKTRRHRGLTVSFECAPSFHASVQLTQEESVSCLMLPALT